LRQLKGAAMLINLFFSLSILVTQLYSTDTFEFTVFNKTVVIQDSTEYNDNQRIDEDGMIERTYYSREIMRDYEMSFSEAFRNARKLKGPGQIFIWNGKHYTTDYYYELLISVGDQVTEVNYDDKTYKTVERRSETIAVRSYKDSDKKLITYTYLENL
tara:strand:- start:113 stop:586 length:474 start_codon:yes stop_codon:yes gene_type:complete